MAAGENGSTGTTLARSSGLLLATYAAAIFLSAALLFAVQPLFAKMVLPRLGGSPSVWSVAMVFFQAVLLAGYAYAHVLTRHLSGRGAVVVHVALLVVATLALPLAIASGWGRPPARGGTLWLLGLFAVSIGLPFFALSANGPLLQAWFARTGHPSAKDPYFLYAASNVGSFLALMSYPLLVEPFTHLPDQTRMWSVAFYLLIVLIAGCGVLLARSRNALPEVAAAEAGDEAPPTWRAAATWVGLAAVPAGLLIAVTAHVSTDVAASPMLWVIPLALYLATFVIVFQTKPVLPHRWVVLVEPAFIILLVAVLVFSGLDQIFLVGAATAGRPAPHRLLYVDVDGRHDRRHRGRPDRAARLLHRGGISDPDRARHLVPTGRRRGAGRPRKVGLARARRSCAHGGRGRSGVRLHDGGD